MDYNRNDSLDRNYFHLFDGLLVVNRVNYADHVSLQRETET